MKKLGLALIGTGWITAAFIQAARMSEAYDVFLFRSLIVHLLSIFANNIF